MAHTHTVAVIGAGTMGARIAAVFAQQGFIVRLWSRSAASLDKARALLTSLAPDGQVHYSTALPECLAGADIVSENVAEQVALKQTLFAEIETLTPAHCLLTSNTSSVSITLLAGGLRDPGRLVGMHWFNPAEVMPMVEIVRGAHTTDATCERALALCQQLGKEAVLVNQDIPGFIVNRLQYALLREALYLVTQGIGTVADVDRAVEMTLAPRWAALGPMKLMDFAGLDTVDNVARILLPELNNATALPEWLLAKIHAGQLGAKSGAGFYTWAGDDARDATQHRDSVVRQLTAREPDNRSQ